MTRPIAIRILTIGAVTAVLIAAVMVNLSLLDIITAGEMRETLGRSLLVVTVSTVAIVLTGTILGIGRRQSAPRHEAKG